MNASKQPQDSTNTVPLQARNDLFISESVYSSKRCWVVKDPVKLNYFRLDSVQYSILNSLEMERTQGQLLEMVLAQNPSSHLTAEKLQSILLDLYSKGLLISTRVGQAITLIDRSQKHEWKKLKSTITNVLFIRFPGFDPTWTLKRFDFVARILFHPITVLLAFTLVCYTWVFIVTHLDTIGQRLPTIESHASLQSVLLFWIVIGATKLLHEFGHAFACRFFGGECHEIGLAFLVFSPCLYCDVSDSWTLASRWRRIAIALSGIYVELVISSICFFGWWQSETGLINQLCFIAFVVTTISTVAFNLNPLLRLDGYYVLSDALGIPNLRQRADEYLQRFLLVTFGGFRFNDQPSYSDRRTLLALFSIASMIYRSILTILICWLLYQFLLPVRLGFLGLALGLLCALLGFVVWLKRIKALAKRANRQENSIRPQISVGLSIVFLFALFFAPVPINVKGPLRLELAQARHIYALHDSLLKACFVKDGEHVQPGQDLASLVDHEIELKLGELATRRKVLEIELRKNKAQMDFANEELTSQQLVSIESEMKNLKLNLRDYQLKSPISGTILAPRLVQHDRLSKSKLPGWNGSPIEKQNVGCRFKKGTRLFSVIPDNQTKAIMKIGHIDALTIRPGQNVVVKLNHQPFKKLSGRVTKLVTAASSTEAESHGNQNQDFTDTYSVHIELHDNAETMISGLGGNAKISAYKMTIAQWIWRNVQATFKFT